MESGELHAEGDGELGHAWSAARLTVRGQYRVFDVGQEQREQSEVSWRVGGDGWFRLGEPRLELSLGASGELAQYTNDTVFYSPVATTDEISQMVRTSAAVGLNVLRAPVWGARMRVRGGWQREVYLRTAVDQGATLRDEERIDDQVQVRAQADMEYRAIDGVLALVPGLDLETFTMTRSKATLVFEPSTGLTSQAELVDARRVDVSLGLEFVLLALDAAGVSPFAYARGRYVSTAGAGSAVSIWVPSAGLGLRTSNVRGASPDQ